MRPADSQAEQVTRGEDVRDGGGGPGRLVGSRVGGGQGEGDRLIRRHGLPRSPGQAGPRGAEGFPGLLEPVLLPAVPDQLDGAPAGLVEGGLPLTSFQSLLPSRYHWGAGRPGDDPRRPLPPGRGDRPRGHGRRLPGHRPAHRGPRGGQGAAPALRPRPGVPRAPAPRGAHRRRADLAPHRARGRPRRRRRPRSSCSSTSPARRCRSLRREGRLPLAAALAICSRWRGRWRTPTPTGSCTATSSRRTSSSWRARSRCWTSASPAPRAWRA